MKDVIALALMLGEKFDRCGIDYFLGGSLASSLQGEPRATNDIDFVVDMNEQKAHRLAQELGPDFDVDEEALLEAARHRGSWNIIFLPTVTKIDLFVLRNMPFDKSEFSRREIIYLEGRPLFIKKPEDTVLRKLLWYRSGGEVSERQWRDVVEVLRNSHEIDQAYLQEWATKLAVDDLLKRALAEAPEPKPR